MIVYRVHVAINREVHDVWHAWMIETHIPEVLDTGCFVEARMLRDADQDDEESLSYQFEYVARSLAELDRYRSDFAPALKKDHAERFAGKVEAWREVLEVLSTTSRS